MMMCTHCHSTETKKDCLPYVFDAHTHTPTAIPKRKRPLPRHDPDDPDLACTTPASACPTPSAARPVLVALRIPNKKLRTGSDPSSVWVVCTMLVVWVVLVLRCGWCVFSKRNMHNMLKMIGFSGLGLC